MEPTAETTTAPEAAPNLNPVILPYEDFLTVAHRGNASDVIRPRYDRRFARTEQPHGMLYLPNPNMRSSSTLNELARAGGTERFNIQNSITGLETAIESGANAIEVDIIRTVDGIVTSHGSPIKDQLDVSTEEFLANKPEAFTLNELLSWAAKQDERVNMFIELKSDISLKELTEAIESAIPLETEDREAALASLRRRIMLYGKNSSIEAILEDKNKAAIPTEELRLVYLSNITVGRKIIDRVDRLNAGKSSKIFAVEQGMVPLGMPGLAGQLRMTLGEFRGKYSDFREVVKYAREKGLRMIMGTINQQALNLDPQLTRWLIDCGVYGIVPNDPARMMDKAKLSRPEEKPFRQPQQEDMPKSMRKRLGIAI